MRPEK